MSTDPEPISTWLQSSVSALTSQCSIVLYCGFFFLQYTPRNLRWTRMLAEMTRTNGTASAAGRWGGFPNGSGGREKIQVCESPRPAAGQRPKVRSGLVSRPPRRRLGKQQWARGLAELSDRDRRAGREMTTCVRRLISQTGAGSLGIYLIVDLSPELVELI